MIRKVCSKCRIEKELSEFHKRSRTKDGYNYNCKKCRSSETKDFYEKHKDKILEKIKKYRNDNKEHIKKLTKLNRIKNREKILKWKKEWSKSENGKKSKQKYYQNNCEKIKNQTKLRRKNNPEKYKEFDKIKRNKDGYNEYRSEYVKKHKKLNPHIYAWRTVLNNSFKRLGTKKEGYTIDLLGYSAIELKKHLESKFSENMTWNNWGKWHIDHIKPVSSFDKSEKPSVVNSLNNLQPLWANDNLKKGKKIVNNLKNNTNN